MTRILCAGLAAAGLLAGHLHLAAAEAGRLRHLVSVYFDEQGAGLSLPEGVACGANGQVVIGDTGNDRLVRFTFRDKSVSEVRAIRPPQVAAPSRIQLNSKGDIYALDSRQRRIVRLSPEGAFAGILAFTGVPSPSTVVPKSFAIDASDNLYVLDVFSARVLVVDAQGKFARALALPDGARFGTDVAIDAAGSLFLIDSIARRMYSAARDASSFAPLGGDLSESVVTLPTSIAATRGLILVPEGTGGSILAFGRDGSFVSRQLKMGWEEGALNHPSQLCVNDKDEVFIADRDNSRVQIFQLVR